MNDGAKLPAGWAKAKVGEIVSLVNGYAFKPSDWNQSGLPIIRIQNLNNHEAPFNHTTTEVPEKYRVKNGDLLFAWSGTPGTSFGAHIWHGEDALLNQHIYKVVFDETALEPKFLREAINYNLDDYIRQAHGGAGLAHITKGKFEESELLIAPLAEQRRIIDKLDELLSDLDAGDTALERARANLKKYRAAVLRAAVTGELTAEWRSAHPNVEPATKLLDRILAERRRNWEIEQEAKFTASRRTPLKGWRSKYPEPPTLDPSDLSELPPSWCWAKVNQVGEVQLGRQRSPAHHNGPYMRPYLRVANVFENRIDTSDVLQMNFTPAEYETYQLNFGDILLNEGQSLHLVGRPAMYRDEVLGACFQNTLVRFRAAPGVLPKFSLYVFLAYLHNRRFQKIARWTVNIAHLGADRFSSIEFPLPPVDEQRAIVAEVEQQLSDIEATDNYITASLKRAARLRQSILKEAFAGRLVPQDPNDEPASVLLDRIRTSSESQNGKAKVRTRNPRQREFFE